MKKALFLMMCLCFSISVLAQAKTVTGTVVDAIGEPIIGASVLEMGTTNGTITDVDGNFTLQVPEGTKLEVSFLGYKSQQIVVGAQSHYKVVLKEDTEVLDEVVVVGYGVKQKRSTMTTAISKMDSKVLENAAIANAAQALQGSVSGLRVTNTSGAPGSSPTIVLRGGAGIESAGSPLVVVDGVVRSMDDVNPADIESIQVLKDAASTAIYGARANNGVILVQTKKGKEGVAQISYKFKGGLNFARKGYEYMDAENYIKYGRLGRQYSGGSLSQIDGMRGYGAVYGQNNPEQFSIRYLDGNEDLLQEGWKQMTDPISGKQIVFKDYGTTLRDEVYKDPAFTQDHYLSFTGGNEKGTFAASLGYYSEDGTVKGTQYRRFSGTLNGNYKVLPILNIKGGVNFSTSEAPELYYDDTADLFERLQSVEPTWNPYLPDGSPNYGYGKRDGNPLYWLDKLTNQNNTRRTTLNIGADLELIKDKLYLRENSSLYYSDYTKETFDKAYRDYWNENTERKASFEYTRTIQQQHSLQLEYTDTFKEKHNLSAMVGGEYFENQYLQYKGTADGAPFDQIPTLNVSGRDNMWSYSYRQGYRIASGFARVTYDYERRYLFTAVARYDGISKLSDNRWGFFPSTSLAWILSEEGFLKDVSFLNNLKLRAGYGVSGNLGAIDSYNSLQLMKPNGVVSVNGAPTVTMGVIRNANPDLKWEVKRTFNVGLDAGFFQNRLILAADYYHAKTSDMLYLYDVSVPPFAYNKLLANLGSMENSGVELGLGITPLQKKDMELNINVNVAFQKNKLLSLSGMYNGQYMSAPQYTPIASLNGAGFHGGNNHIVYQIVGESLGVFYLPHCTGLVEQADGSYRYEVADLNGNGVNLEDGEDRYVAGQATPKAMLGSNFSFRYRNFDISLQINGAFGHKIYNGTALSYMNMGSFPDYNVMKGAPEQRIKDQTATDYWLENGDYVNFDYLTVGWNVPLGKLKKYIRYLRLSASVNNLATITAYSGLTPMINSSIVNSTLGVDDKRNYPVARSYSIGLNFQF